MDYLVLVVGSIICAVLAIRATRLLTATLWLAGVSVLTAIILYRIGAHFMAVVELSLSVGLVTILQVFAITMVGAGSPDQPVLRPMNWALIVAMFLLVIGLALPHLPNQPGIPEATFPTIFWQLRQADVLAQIAMIFSGVLGLLGLLAETRVRRNERAPIEEPIQSGRENVTVPTAVLDGEPESELEKV